MWALGTSVLTASVQGRAEEVRARINAGGVNIIVFGEVAHGENVDVDVEGSVLMCLMTH